MCNPHHGLVFGFWLFFNPKKEALASRGGTGGGTGGKTAYLRNKRPPVPDPEFDQLTLSLLSVL